MVNLKECQFWARADLITQLNSDQRQVSVDFLALGASLGEKLKYEYRLERPNGRQLPSAP